MRRSSLLLSLTAAALLGACSTSSDRDRYPVFFDTASTTISPVASDIIAKAAADARNTHASTIEVIGHAGAHGNLSADELLAMTRAKNVAAQLATDGVGDAKITQFALPPSNNQDAAVASRVVTIEIDPNVP
ncbi:hypothetical protein AA101099_0828 [Neoasaia chiangmaiensis NBRC 101099]|uniref:Uncharacterized protein n=1 Tax=Neoasaia chiangmaiensis TaxID=320497 RepID=A0A1U9KME3_9PROT|nr:OmpA family protein [Neoasaia chiangmaiensis]AQS86953.1 hypothetical protein A0U93_02210 [Neoasaia chiangmaiensis]GBR37678.1 hypothetical protein AA101099_0828 [Neoasaia chiangmaiensis NBRC 101099]GEN15066.1 hypothetical protein NCH01_14970 [Neoasaia chiangmaiensis]